MFNKSGHLTPLTDSDSDLNAIHSEDQLAAGDDAVIISFMAMGT